VTCVSLFSSGGIGDLALRSAGIDTIVSNELLKDRHSVFKHNFPQTKHITGDIWQLQNEIISECLISLKGKPLDFILATPPCQGMSKNGRGKLLSKIRAGESPKFDERNRLIIPTVNIVKELKPDVIVFENVPEMGNTLIEDCNNKTTGILDYITSELSDQYAGKAEVVEFANYGVPQRRQRLISVFTKNKNLKKHLKKYGSLMPPKTHYEKASNDSGYKKWNTVRDVIGKITPLDAKDKNSASSDIEFHSVPVLDSKKYSWVSNTPLEKSAFDNQCQFCDYNENITHSSSKDVNGINRSSKKTPIYCCNCGKLLPRPYVEKNGEYRLMKGFTSAYKRMKYDAPSPTLTRNLSYACSDKKLHPTQNRVLSLYEAFILHTIDKFDYEWLKDNSTRPSNKTIREIIGESIPPSGLKVIFDFLLSIRDGVYLYEDNFTSGLPLFSNSK
jgi:DNA (cytosine-5)-methyltransferase 1